MRRLMPLLVFFVLLVLIAVSSTALAQNPDPLSYTKQTILGRGPAWDVTWSPDGRKLAVTTPIDIWIYSDSLEDVVHIENQTDYPDFPYATTWSPDGQMIACVAGTYLGYEVIVWDAATGEVRFNLEDDLARPQGTVSLAWKPDSRQIAVGTGDGEIRIWTVPTGESVARLSTTPVASMSWSDDGNELQSVHIFDSAIRVWDLSTLTVQRVLTYPKNTFRNVVWNPDSRTFASLYSSIVYIGNTETDSVLGELRAPKPSGSIYPLESVTSLAWGRTNDLLAVAWHGDREHGFVQVWDVRTGEVSPAYASIEGTPIRRIAWSPDNSTFAIIRWDGTIELRDAISGELLHENDLPPKN